VLYPVSGDTHVAELKSRADAGPVAFAGTGGERFVVAARDIAALHLAAVDEDQGPAS
jgi:hypothetical protein